jgi:hypothetical protein
MLLFGSGLIGLASLRRRSKKVNGKRTFFTKGKIDKTPDKIFHPY